MSHRYLLYPLHALAASALVMLCFGPLAAASFASPMPHGVTAVVANKQPQPCITVYLKKPLRDDCFASLSAGAMSASLNALNLHALNRQLKAQGVGRPQRLKTLDLVRNTTPKRIYDQAKVARSDRIKAAVAACAIGAIAGGLLSALGALIAGKPALFGVLFGSFLGCIGPALVSPASKEATHRLTNYLKFHRFKA